MSFFSKLLGGTFESNQNEGDALLTLGHYGDAKLAYERALNKAKGRSTSDIDVVKRQIRTCRIALARSYIEQADQEAQESALERALSLLQEAEQICEDPELILQVNERKKQYEADEARRLATAAEEINEEELLAIIAGTWTDPQADEYAALPDAFSEALLAAQDGDHEKAAAAIAAMALLPDLKVKPRYIWFELGKELLAAQQYEQAIAALDKFFTATEEDEKAFDVQFQAMAYNAQALIHLKRFDEAKAEFKEMTRLDPANHEAFLNLGEFLRAQGELSEALAALEHAVSLMGEMHPDFRVIRELGFTYLAMGQKREAQQSLAAVIEHIASKGEHDQFDPEAAVALATLYEENGELQLASDLHRHLATGYDVANHFKYNLESARLLKAQGADSSIAERYWIRARELAKTPEQTALVEQLKTGQGA